MRVRHFAAMALTAAAVTLTASVPATAGDLSHSGVVVGIFPGGPDPYEYRSRPVGWYPYFNSGQWKTRADMRYRYRRPLLVGEYWSAWGYPVGCADHSCRTKKVYRRASK